MGITGLKTVGPKSYTTAGGAGESAFDIVFDGLDFYKATGFDTLTGPFSMALTVDSQMDDFNILFGVDIVTQEKVVHISDRKHLDMVLPFPASKTISSASIPSFASVKGVVTKIIVHFYAVTAIANRTLRVTLQLDAENAVFAAPPFVGADESIYHPGLVLIVNSIFDTIGAGVTNKIICQVSTLNLIADRRFRLLGLMMYLDPTASIAQADMRFHIDIAGTGLTAANVAFLLRSDNTKTDKLNMQFVGDEWVFPSTPTNLIVSGNNSGAALIGLSAAITIELLF